LSNDQTLNKLKGIIREFTESQSDVKGQIVIAYPDGVPIVNTWKGKIDPILVGALSAAVKLTFRYLCNKLRKGELKRLYMNSDYGRVIIQNAGKNAILTTIIDKNADLFRIAFGMSNISIELEKLLKGFKLEVSDI
jgi:predicted regulator of Ras-like GTPase activity (Roadblock/LC7/MglB family)